MRKSRALTGPQGGTLTLELVPAVRVLEHLHVRLLAPGATEADTLNRKDVAVHDGIATINLGPVVRGTRLDVQVQVESATSARTLVVRGKATARLRPDLVVAAVRTPAQTLSTRPIDVVADVSTCGRPLGSRCSSHTETVIERAEVVALAQMRTNAERTREPAERAQAKLETDSRRR